MGRSKGTPRRVNIQEILHRIRTSDGKFSLSNPPGMSASTFRAIRHADGWTTEETKKNIIEALGCKPHEIEYASPTNDTEPAALKIFCESIAGPWHLYHYMSSKSGGRYLINGILEITAEGVCRLTYQRGENKRPVVFTGTLKHEADTRFVVLLSSTSPSFKETRVIHGRYFLEEDIHDAVWSGTDYTSKPYCSHAIFSKNDLKLSIGESAINKILNPAPPKQ